MQIEGSQLTVMFQYLIALPSEQVLWLGVQWALLTACLTDPGLPFILNTK
jgi:hypothetical protein